MLSAIQLNYLYSLYCIDSGTNYILCLIRRKPTNRKLWDKTSDRWEHDMYREEEQGPKTKEELEVRW